MVFLLFTMTKQCSKYFCLLIRYPSVSLLKYLSKALRGRGLGYTQRQSVWPAHRPWVWLLPSLSLLSSWLVVVSLAWFSCPFWWWPEPSWAQGRAYWAGSSCFALFHRLDCLPVNALSDLCLCSGRKSFFICVIYKYFSLSLPDLSF